MWVKNLMKKEVVTVDPDDSLEVAYDKMKAGNFRHLPVVERGLLVGIITDRDLRHHFGYLDRTKVNAAMTENPLAVTTKTTLEEAAEIMLESKIGALPVVEKDRLVGILTTSDLMVALLDLIGASSTETVRIDLLLGNKAGGFPEVAKVIAEEGREIVGMGTYRDTWGESPICYLRIRDRDPEVLASLLKEKGYDVLGVHA